MHLEGAPSTISLPSLLNQPAGKKFIAGEPMSPAQTGSLENHTGSGGVDLLQ